MQTTRGLGALLVVLGLLAGSVRMPVAAAQQPPPEPPPPGAAVSGDGLPAGMETTPPRVSFLSGEVSFWRPGAADWAPARLNTPLAPGDLLYTGPRGNVELQIGSRAFARAAPGTHIGLENLEPDFVQFKLTTGQFSLDLRDLAAGTTIELATPNAVFTVERTGYYRADVGTSATTFITRRGGRATVTPAGGTPVVLTPSEHVVVTGTESPQVETYVAPELSEWDRWNYARTDYLLEAVSARYVPAGIYGARDLDRYGAWRVTPDYGAVWVPDATPPAWAPYSLGRWMWDPRYGWTWIDDAPWGWAPYHYGRWVSVHGLWAWAPGPIVVRPVYAPALVAFFGGPAVGRPLAWVALGWGEPCVPWWGPRGFIGHAWWGGWGGPRVVNRVVVQRTTVVNVKNITVYQNAAVANAVVAVPSERFGRDPVSPARVPRVDVRNLAPVHGALDVKPVPASLVPATGTSVRPPEAVQRRPVVATRAPREIGPAGRVEVPAASPGVAAPPPARLVPPPVRPDTGTEPARPPFGRQTAPERARPPEPPRLEGPTRTAPPRSEVRQAPIETQRPPVAAPWPGAAPSRPAPRPETPTVVAPSRPAPRPETPTAAPSIPPRAPAPQPQPSQAPASPAPRVQGPERPQRALPGEPANRLFPGSGERRADRPSDKSPAAAPPVNPQRRTEPPAAPQTPQRRIEPPAAPRTERPPRSTESPVPGSLGSAPEGGSPRGGGRN